MKMDTRVAISNMKYHKGKNVIIGIAILLTSFLLFLVPTMGYDLINGQFTVVNEIYPTWHAIIRNIDSETAEKIANYHDIDECGLRSDIGYINCDDAKISLMTLDDTALSLYRISIDEGKFPEKENEIVVSPGILKAMGIEAKIGDTIKLPYQVYRNGGLDYTQEKEFVISGFMADSEANNKQKVYTAFASKEFLFNEVSEDDISWYAVIRIVGKNNAVKKDIEKNIYDMADQFGVDKEEVGLNGDYLMANYIDPSVIPIIAVIMIIIVLAGIITIYSIYYVNMPERIKEYGRLKAIGATRHQIRTVVLKEGFAVTAIALPLGLIIGTILTRVMFVGLLYIYEDENVIVSTMKELLEKKEISLYNPWIYVLAIVVTLVTVYVSLLKPMKVASSISEIQAMRYNEGDASSKVRSKSVKNGKTAKGNKTTNADKTAEDGKPSKRNSSNKATKSKVKKSRKSYDEMNIFRLSKIYLLKNKKNSIITIVSMGITGVFLMVIATVLSCANPRESANNSVLGQYRVAINTQEGNKEHPEREWGQVVKNSPMDDDLLKQLEDIDGIKSVSVFKGIHVTSDSFPESVEEIGGVPDEYMDRLIDGITEGDVTKEELKTGKKVIVDTNLLYWFPNIKIGDTLKLCIDDGNENSYLEVQVAAFGEYEIGFTNYNNLLMSNEGVEKLYNENTNEVYQLFANKDFDQDIFDNIKSIVDQDDLLQMDSWNDHYNEWKSAISTTTGAAYAFLGIISMICIMNMVNTMINSVHIRKKEIGMMQAMGMTDNQLVRMLVQEGLFYTIGTLIMSVGLGSALGYPVFLWAKNNHMFNISHYHYPVTTTIVIIVVLVLIQAILAIALGRSVKKESLIERIRFSE